jgi:hypothetical protein
MSTGCTGDPNRDDEEDNMGLNGAIGDDDELLLDEDDDVEGDLSIRWCIYMLCTEERRL